MKNNIVENKIYNIVKECMTEEIERQRNQRLHTIIREEVIKHLKNRVNEEGEGTKTKDSVKRKNVMQALNDPQIKQSEVMRDLWGVKKGTKEDDEKRSLFSKKVNGTPDADGNVRTFNNDEINKLFNILSKGV